MNLPVSSRLRTLLLCALLILGGCATMGPDPLPSWSEGPAKQAIVSFVQQTTDKASPQFVPADQRIATFDQDGTLWVEQPLYAQVMFALDRVKDVVRAKPALANEEPFKTVISGDRAAMAKLTERDLFTIVAASEAGLSVEQFHDVVRSWIATVEASEIPASLYRAHLRADAGSDEVPACQWLSNLHRDRWRAGIRARVRGDRLRRSAGAGRRNHVQDRLTKCATASRR